METREEILGKLYALRAGLSYIATQSYELQDALISQENNFGAVPAPASLYMRLVFKQNRRREGKKPHHKTPPKRGGFFHKKPPFLCGAAVVFLCCVTA